MSDPLSLMVLPSCTLFPKALLPLHIFEPRYRQMLDEALAGTRMFGIGTPLSRIGEDSSEPGTDQIFPVTVTGLIRACIGNPDGTSNLILQGVERVRITGWCDGQPYRVAETVPFLSEGSDSQATADAAAELAAAARKVWGRDDSSANQRLGEYLENVDDPETLADVVASHLVGDLETRLAILGEPSVSRRIELVIEALDALD